MSVGSTRAGTDAHRRRRRIAVVIPAYRAAATIAEVIRSIPSAVDDVIVVDDASPDGLSDVVTEAADPRVTMLRHDANGGVGAAMLTGYAEALRRGAEIVVKLDADGQMDPRDLPRLVRPIQRGEADYTKGNRFVHGRELARMPPLRRLGNMALSFLTKAASGYWQVFDPTNGYTAIHAAALTALDRQRIARRWLFETSMLIELYLARAVVRDVTIPARYGNEVSSLSPARALLQFPPRLLAATIRRLWLRHVVTDFSPVALFTFAGSVLFLFGLVWGGWHWLEVARTGVTASTGTVMIAVLPLILGTQLLLQAIVLDMQSAPTVPLSRDTGPDDTLPSVDGS